MNNKKYESPELEIEKFTINEIVSTSRDIITDKPIEGGGDSFETGEGEDYDF